MDINQSSLSHLKSNKSGTPRSDSQTKSISESSKLRETSASSTVQNLKQQDLKEGQVIKGQIIDHRYNEVSIKLETSKQVITAKLSEDVPLSIGQNAQFQVTEESSDRLVLKYIPNETTPPTDATINKALTASTLPMTERNKAIVEELLNHRMPIDKQTLQTLIKLSNTNREATPLTLVLMYKNNLPMTSANIKQFEVYQNGTHQLLNDIQDITKSISELLKQSAMNGHGQQTLDNMLETKNTSLESGQQTMMQTNMAEGSNLPEKSNLSEKSILSEQLNISNQLNMHDQLKDVVQINGKLLDILFNNSPDFKVTNALGSELNNFLGQKELSLLGNALGQKAEAYTNLPAGIPPDIAQQIKSGTLSLEETVKMIARLYEVSPEQMTPTTIQTTMSQGQTNPLISQIITSLLEPLNMQDNPARLDTILNSAQRAELLDSMSPLLDSGSIKNQIADGSATIRETLTFLHDSLSGAADTVARNLLQSSEYMELLEKAFQQKWTITPEKLAQKTPVMDLYQNLQEDLEKLNTLANNGRMSEEAIRLQEPVKNMQENLRFMKDLNEMFTYLQLPVQLKDKDIHSDLYVFTRKKAQLGKKDSISVLLHLDMTNLGPLNIHIQMEHNLIHAKFYLEDSKAEQLISDNLPTLTSTLQDKGYNLHTEIMDSYEKPDF
ncbi:MAG: flagellar hook-length control protein FliK, partial [Mobilitalea sp.]